MRKFTGDTTATRHTSLPDLLQETLGLQPDSQFGKNVRMRVCQLIEDLFR